MKIAICDDEQHCRESFRQILLACKEMLPDLSIASFSSGDELISCYLKQEMFDVIFLDIEMPGLSGLETGHQIRKMDKNAIIVFLTSFEHYVFQTFEIETFDFLTKPVQMDTAQSLIRRIATKYQHQHYFVHIKWQEQSHSLEVHEIAYVEGYDRHAIFHTNRTGTGNTFKKYECVGKLNDYEKKLNSYGFLRCHQGFLVNMRYITDIGSKQISINRGLTDSPNEEIDMSVRKKADCLRAYNKYLARRSI
ncbi:DNA-binding response regulator [Clostridia bacterium]|nr:DNA-binding response regulator [Clostridia bacterium]